MKMVFKTKITPQGYETKFRFSKRIGVHPRTVTRLMKRGLPTLNGNVHIEDGLTWWGNWRLRLAGYETQTAFAKRIGMAGVGHLLKKGLPTIPGGTAIHIEDGLKWCNDYYPKEYENQDAFAKRVGVSHTSVSNWVKRGLPTYGGTIPNHSIRIHIANGMEWVKQYRPNRSEAHKWKKLSPEQNGYETQTAFAKRVGVTSGTISKWSKLGLPMLPGGAAIHIADGLRWVDERSLAWLKQHDTKVHLTRSSNRR